MTMDNSEKLREALLDLDESRNRERQQRKTSEMLLAGLHAIVMGKNPDDIFHRLLDVLREPLGFEAAFVLRESRDGSLKTIASSDPAFAETVWQPRAMFERVFSGQPAAAYDIEIIDEWRAQPDPVKKMARSALHFAIHTCEPRALFVCTHPERAHFSQQHVTLAHRFSVLAMQALQKIDSGLEITKLKQAEKQIDRLNLVLRAVRNVSQLITKEKDQNRLLQGVCDILTKDRGYATAWIALLDDNKKVTATAQSGLAEDFEPMAKQLRRGELTHCVKEVLNLKESIIKNPIMECADCPLASKYEGRTSVSVRLEHEGKIHGLITISVPQGLAQDEEERSIFREAADDIAFALHNLEIEAARKKLEVQLISSQRLESVGRLAGGVAHDFNNLLTVILSSCSFIIEELRMGDPLIEDLRQIDDAAKRAVSLTRQLLAFSRRQMLQVEAIDLNKTLEDLDKMLRRLIGEDIDIATKLDNKIWKVEADPGQIEQIVMNLVVNARDAMPTGGKLTLETANVELDETYARDHVDVTPGPHVMLAVSDTGCGMDAETMGQIFEPFFTTKEKDRGTGLGLSTVYGIVKQHKGNIWVYSEPGKGAIFKVYLPKTGATEAQAQKNSHANKDSGGNETVLVVEDEAAVLKLAVRALERKGYKVLQAGNGLEGQAVADAHDGPIQLLLTDVVMPKASGKEMAEKLLAKRPKLKVVFMSGYTDNSIVHHGVLDKGMHFVQKPFTANSLT
ncbi:MAG: response regulator, partial [Deltaproteobacteria bacterium]|nr:response regulator [Deltaproteobacteria bacterium]